MNGAPALWASVAGSSIAAVALVHGLRLVAASGSARVAVPPALAATTRVALARSFGSVVAAARAMGGAAIAGLLVGMLLERAVLALVTAAAVIAAAAVHARLVARRRDAAVVAQLPAVAAALATALKAGLSLRQALTRVARDAPQPAASELARLAHELDLGARVERSLGGFGERLGDRDVRLMVAAIQVQRVAGGDLAAALSDLATRLGERARLARELRSLTAQARLTAWMVGALPVVAAILVELASPGALGASLLRGPGLLALVVSLALYAVGAALVVRIARVRM